jgi:hypothetical protein
LRHHGRQFDPHYPEHPHRGRHPAARLQKAGLDIGHVLLAIAPNGAGVVRSNVGPAELGDMADLPTEIASSAAL